MRRLNSGSGEAGMFKWRLHGAPCVATTLLAVLAVLVVTTATAQASTTYVRVGEAIGSFGFPLGGVAVDRTTGDLYVVDGHNATVDIYNPSGTLLSSFGGPGSGDGELGQSSLGGPSGIAVDQSNRDVYVTDNINNRVEKFDSSGTYLSQFDGSATPAGSFSTPTSVAVDPADGSVYVADAGNNVVDKFDSSGNVVPGFGAEGAIGGFSFPTFNTQPAAGVAVDSSGRLYVGDPGNGVIDEFDSSGNFQGQLGSGALSAPSELAVDSSDNVVAVDSANRSVTEFNSGGEQLATFSTSASSPLRGVAVSADGSHVYVSTTTFLGGGGSQVLIFARVTLPDVATGAASNPQQTTATLDGTVNPDGVQLIECRFDYTDDADFQARGYTGPAATSAPCNPDAASIPADHSDHNVTADLTGLSPNTTYDFRLVAANASGAAHGHDLTFRTPGPPVIDSTSVTDVTSTEAILKAQVNPESSDTTFHFEYGTTTSYGTSAPVPDGDLGTGSGDQLARTPISGLSPSTTYHLRMVANNGEGTIDGPDHTFTTFAPVQSGLPDGRAYELVTSVETAGNDIGHTNLPVFDSAISSDGDHVIYTSDGAFADAPNGLGGHYVATRTTDGWVTTPAALPPGRGFLGGNSVPDLQGIAPDFSTVFYSTPNAIDPNDQNASTDVYAFHVPDRSTSWISQSGRVETAPVKSTFVGSSADGSHVLFDTAQPLTASDAGQLAGQALYDRSDGETDLVDVNTDGSLTSACGAKLGNVQTLSSGTPKGSIPAHSYAVSANGSHIFFESPDPQGSGDASCSPAQGGTQPVELYLRENGATTTEISLSQRAGAVAAPAPGGATFQGATPDGSRVFFTSPDQLTDDPAAASGGLYRYDVSSAALTFIAGGPGTVYTERVGEPLISNDGSHVYLLASVPGNGPSGTNLYLWAEGRISFISPAPAPPNKVDAHISSDGRTLAFTAANDVTGYYSHGLYEVYVYHATTKTLTCISCDTNGVAPIGNATFFGESLHETNLASRLVSDDGRRVFFASPDRLLPQATNGLLNVYEWEAEGSGSCNSGDRGGGCLFLLSDGSGPDQAWLVGASADGRDVLFATNASLVPQDEDGGDADLYDARVDGGFPSATAAGPCLGDSCRDALAAQPETPSIGSIAFSGPGNSALGEPSTIAKVKVTRTSYRGAAFLVSVKVPGRGRVAGAGYGLTSVKRTVGKAGTYTLTFKLTTEAGRALKRKHKLVVRARVTYTPASGASSSATVSATFRRPRTKVARAGRARRATMGAGR